MSLTCCATVVKMPMMSSHQWAELNPKNTGGGQKWPISSRPLVQMKKSTHTQRQRQLNMTLPALLHRSQTDNWSLLTPYIPVPTCFSLLFCTVRQTQTFSPALSGLSARCLSLSNQPQPKWILCNDSRRQTEQFPLKATSFVDILDARTHVEACKFHALLN